MSSSHSTNRRIVLAERPHGLPNDNTLRLEEGAMPEPNSGEMLLRTRYLSLDPYMRGRMNDAKSYAEPVAIGEVMTGQVVAEVISSSVNGYGVGDWVLAGSGWQDFSISNGSDTVNLGKSPSNPTWALGILGMPGYTAYAGLMKIGEPKAGETVVVAAASGPVGATVGQIAKLQGCHVVGIAGGAAKCKHVIDKLGFDACIDHKSENFSEELILPLVNPFARIPVCGVVSWYNLTGLPDGPDFGPAIMGTLLRMKVKMQGFIIYDSFQKETYQEFKQAMTEWLDKGAIEYKEQIVEGLENAPKALNQLLQGESFGKMVVSVA